MMLSSETLLGLRITGTWPFTMHACIIHVVVVMKIFFLLLVLVNSFVHLVQYLFSLPGVKDHNLGFLSQNNSKDPLKVFLAARGKGVGQVITQACRSS